MSMSAVEEETERFRQLVIAARSTGAVGLQAEECVGRLNALFLKDRGMFSPEDVRWLNVLRGTLGVRLAAHRPRTPHTTKPKRKGDTLTHCWRCETPVDERFTGVCAGCDSPAYHWMVCPVCGACGCQRSGKVLV
jgi:hypothetical protein